MTPRDYVPRILEAARHVGPDRHAIVQRTGLTFKALDNVIQRYCRDEYKMACREWEAYRDNDLDGPVLPDLTPEPSSINAILDLPPLSFAVPVPEPASLCGGEPTETLVYGDLQVPFHDDRVLGCVFAVAADLKPSKVINVGDLNDCWQISRFDKNPARLNTLQDDLNLARVHLAQMAQVAPQAQRWLLEGNHEARLTKAIWGTEGAARELMKLDVVRENLTWPALLKLDEIGWRFVPAPEQPQTEIIPKVVTKHGTVVRKWSGWTARAEWERYGRATISGHTHRLGAFWHRDHNGVVQSWESGCCCSLTQEYGSEFDWQQGFLVASQTRDLGVLSVEPVSVRDGRCVWRGRVYG